MHTPSREQILAFRYGKHHLNSALSRKHSEAAELRPSNGSSGTVFLALAARIEDLNRLGISTMLFKARSRWWRLTRFAVRRTLSQRKIFQFSRAHPADEKAIEYLGPGTSRLKQSKANPAEAVEAITKAMLSILKTSALTQDEIHAEWRKCLPKKFLWKCKGCKTYHVNPSGRGCRLCERSRVWSDDRGRFRVHSLTELASQAAISHKARRGCTSIGGALFAVLWSGRRFHVRFLDGNFKSSSC